MTASASEVPPEGQCAFPGCEQPRRPRVPGRSGPSPTFCTEPQHNPETARQARVRAARTTFTRVTETAAALAGDLPPEGRVRHLVGRWAVAARDAAAAAEAQSVLLTAAADALDQYRDEATVEARLAQGSADVHAAHAGRLRAEEQAHLAERRAAAAEQARQSAEHEVQATRATAERQVASAAAEAQGVVESATAAQHAAEAARAEAEAAHRAAEQAAQHAEQDRQAARRTADEARQTAQRVQADAARDHDALVEARAEWSVTERALTETVQTRTRERDEALAARDEARAAATTAEQQARDADRERAAARRAEQEARTMAAEAASHAAAAEQARQDAVTDAVRGTQRAEDADRRTVDAETGARAALERAGALSSELGALRARVAALTDERQGRGHDEL